MSDPTGKTGGVVSGRYWLDKSKILEKYFKDIKEIFSHIFEGYLACVSLSFEIM